MTDLADFLRARYAERREQVGGHNGSYNDADGCWGLHEDPADVLADLDAKGAIVALHGRLGDGAPFCITCDAPSGVPGEPHGCPTLRLLAQPFAAHPDYQQEWKP